MSEREIETPLISLPWLTRGKEKKENIMSGG
jgi:hypothetical protein